MNSFIEQFIYNNNKCMLIDLECFIYFFKFNLFNI